MNWIDGVVIGLVVLSGIWGMMRGLVREVLSLAAWLAASIGCVTFLPSFRPYVQDLVRDPYWVDPIAYAAGFVAVLVPLSILAGVLGRATQRSLLGSADRGLGFLFGVARGALLVIVAYVAVGVAVPIAELPPAVREARLMPDVADAAAWTVSRMPPDFQAKLIPPSSSAAPDGYPAGYPVAAPPALPGMAFPHPVPTAPIPTRAVQP